MPIYDVLLTREASEHNTVRVTASSRKQAESKALKKAGRYGEKIDGWELDDGNDHEVYICDPGNCAEEVVEPPQLPGVPARPPLPPVPVGHRSNLETIRMAARAGDLALMQFYAKGKSVTVKAVDGSTDVSITAAGVPEVVTVLCAMQRNEDDTITPIPLARMFSGNPFELLEAPFPDESDGNSGEL